MSEHDKHQDSNYPSVPLGVFDFTKMNAHDGLKIIESVVGGEVSLHLAIKGNDDYLGFQNVSEKPEDAAVELASYHGVTARNLGRADLMKNCLDAIARYKTMGGTWPDLMHALFGMRRAVPDEFIYPGWYYRCGETLYDDQTDSVVVQHIFVGEQEHGGLTPAIVWIEDSFIDLKTLDQITQEREPDVAKEEKETQTEGRPTGSNQLQLPDQSNS